MAPIKYVVSVPLTWCPSPGTPTCGCVALMQSGEEGQDGLDLRFWPLHDPPPPPPHRPEEPSHTAAPRQCLYVWDIGKKSPLVSLKHLP